MPELDETANSTPSEINNDQVQGDPIHADRPDADQPDMDQTGVDQTEPENPDSQPTDPTNPINPINEESAQLVRMENLRTISAGGFSAVCDAYAVNPLNEGIYFISMIGPQTSVKAIWSKLLNSPPSPAFISKGVPGLSAIEDFTRYVIPQHIIGSCTTKISKLPNKNGWHAMVYTKNAEYTNPNDSFLLIARNEEEAPKLHYRFLDKRVTVPIHESWALWLWERGLENSEIIPLECLKIVAYWCEPKVSKLREDLTLAIQNGEISLDEPSAAPQIDPDSLNQKLMDQELEDQEPGNQEASDNQESGNKEQPESERIVVPQTEIISPEPGLYNPSRNHHREFQASALAA